MEQLEDKLQAKFDEFGLVNQQRDSLMLYLGIVKKRDLETWEHSVRVGLLGADIAQFTHIVEPKGLFYPGLLHDVGKSMVDPKSLKKKKDFGPEDMEEVRKHVMYGYKLLIGIHDFSAWVLLFHHYFQENGYPSEMEIPKFDPSFSKGTKALIMYSARLLSIADFYDAATNRRNEKFVPGIQDIPNSQKVREAMFGFNPDQKYLIGELYNADIFR